MRRPASDFALLNQGMDTTALIREQLLHQAWEESKQLNSTLEKLLRLDTPPARSARPALRLLRGGKETTSVASTTKAA